MDIDKEIQELLEVHHAYYNGEPIMADSLYDARRDNLANNYGDDPKVRQFLIIVGTPPSGDRPTVKHAVFMGSQTNEDIEKMLDGFSGEKLSPEKLDRMLRKVKGFEPIGVREDQKRRMHETEKD